MRPIARLFLGGAVAAGTSLIIFFAFFAFFAAASDEAAQADRDRAARALPERVDGHRPLRANPPDQDEDPAAPDPFTGFDDAPAYSVVSRSDALNFYPCADCHEMMPANPERRKLSAPHPGILDHGAGRMWCLDCHAPGNRNVLMTLAAQEVSFDEADRVCGQCHARVHRDWAFGAHGKRVSTWQEDRELYNCTHCHNPHDPAVRPRAPEPPPPVRVGLEPMPHTVHDTRKADGGEESNDG